VSEIRVHIRQEMDAIRAVLEATEQARSRGLDEIASRMFATAVSELARNILCYAGSGEIQLRWVEERTRRGIEVVALDKGPGIPDVERALQDHYSSAGTLGLGLPGVRRLMDEFRLESEVGKGTRVTARKWLPR
jgi:serine/threonine-protein kinase RsbT